ncbi:hypothetical protein MRX96_054553 [Rhipicephalus microplus]
MGRGESVSKLACGSTRPSVTGWPSSISRAAASGGKSLNGPLSLPSRAIGFAGVPWPRLEESTYVLGF